MSVYSQIQNQTFNAYQEGKVEAILIYLEAVNQKTPSKEELEAALFLIGFSQEDANYWSNYYLNP